MDRIEELYGILRQFIIKTEVRLDKLEVIHTRYTGDRGPQGPKGDKGDNGNPCGELNEFRNERIAFREELHAFKADLREQFIKHTNDLAQTCDGYAKELDRLYSENVASKKS